MTAPFSAIGYRLSAIEAAAAARAARHGWTLTRCADGYELRGNGAPAAFGTLAAFAVWIDKQEGGKTR
jgi:hypothetical protein